MLTKATAKSNADSARSALTYINNAISGASLNGQYTIIIEPQYMSDAISTDLVTNYGYKVTPMTNGLGSYTRYLISWE